MEEVYPRVSVRARFWGCTEEFAVNQHRKGESTDNNRPQVASKT